MTPLDTKLKEIRERAEKATKPSWIGMFEMDEHSYGIIRNLNVLSEEDSQNDLEFIQHSRTDIPRLEAALRRAIEQRDVAALDDHSHESWDRCKIKYNADLLKILEGE